MGLEQRPYVGSWRLNQKSLVQHTPDALVYINGDTALPGCPKCRSKIEIQQFLTEVSVDAGTQPGSASGSFTLSIPIHHHDSFARDARFLLRPGLEVHVYMRGYFPVKGLYSSLNEPTMGLSPVPPAPLDPDAPVSEFQDIETATATALAADPQSTTPLGPTVQGLLDNLTFDGRTPLTPEQRENVEIIYRGFVDGGLPPALGIATIVHSRGESNWDANATNFGKKKKDVQPGEEGVAFGLFQLNRFGRALGTPSDDYLDGRRVGSAQAASESPGTIYNGQDPILNTGRIVEAAQSPRYKNTSKTPKEQFDLFFFSGLAAGRNPKEKVRKVGEWRRDRLGPRLFGDSWDDPEFNQRVAREVEEASNRVESARAAAELETTFPNLGAEFNVSGAPANTSSFQQQFSSEPGASLLEEAGLGESGLENILAYPYYHTFHGVVTKVDHSYSGGVQTVSVSCNSMLHFWGYHNISTNASLFGARPSNSKLKTSLIGHNFTGMHPYEIMYSLYYDMAGAAGGVGYALKDKTNQSAVSELSGQSLFSLNILYWEKRFNSRMNKLRLHGATGELFSAAQAHFLSNLSSNELTKLIKNRFTDPSTHRNNPSKIFSQSTSLNLFDKKKFDALLFAQKSRPTATGGTGMEVNLAEMQAFVLNIGSLGQPAVFESTYETKLDIANKVAEVTGFEFYQDVDGDFVFKPPFYNMDTSDSRVYRIEDIDIISVGFSEGEPQVTYMTVKGGHFKNTQGTGVENEWGVRGQYIDYRLVAQFGWRPQSFETSYFNDPKSMFYAAVNRMDVLNIAQNTAQVTIPIRPEIRPGYPFYIVYVDTFYYCNSFSHQFSFGGQCTTSLQLVGKRAKFYPPGDPNKRGIEAIDLSNPFLPQRPLGIMTPDGPRLAGMPNVVMALDPTQINPLFSVVGTDLESFDTPGSLANLFQMADQLGIVNKRYPDPQNPKIIKYDVRLPNPADQNNPRMITYSINEEDLVSDAKGKKKRRGGRDGAVGPDETIDVVAASKAYTKREGAASEKIETAGNTAFKLRTKRAKLIKRQDEIKDALSEDPKKLKKQQEELDRLQSELTGYSGDIPPGILPKKMSQDARKKKLAQLRAGVEGELKTVEADQKQVQDNIGADLRDSTGRKDGVAQLLELVDEVKSGLRIKHKDFQNPNSTQNLLDMLSDKKATFSNGSQPGAYRYYSASSPNPDDQGQPLWEYFDPAKDDELNNADLAEGRRIKVTAPSLEGKWAGTTVRGFVSSEQISTSDQFLVKPEAEFGDIPVVNGIRVLTSNPDPAYRKGEVIPTSQIKELMFSTQKANVTGEGNSTFRRAQAQSLGANARKALEAQFNTDALGVPKAEVFLGLSSLDDLFNGAVWKKLSDSIRELSTTIEKKYKGHNIPVFAAPQFPLEVQIKLDEVDPNEPLGPVLKRLKETGNTAKAGSWTVDQLANLGGEVLARFFLEQVARSRQAWLLSMGALRFSSNSQENTKLREGGIGILNDGLQSILGVAFKGNSKQGKAPIIKSVKFEVQSPVFPVSDARGYEVVGSYRYGRDITLDPDSPLDVLHRQDPTSLLSRELVTELLGLLENGEWVSEKLPPGDTRKAKRHLEGVSQRKVSTFNEKALKQLRENMTDTQLIDMGLLTRSTANPSLFEFNFMNWFADGNKEGIHKLPIINGALSLADLTQHTGAHVCQCKAAEANVLLESISQEEFMTFAPGSYIESTVVEGETDKITEFLEVQVARQAVSWEQSQQALRGQVLERARGSRLKSFQSAIEAFGQAAGDRRQAIDDFDQAVGAANEAAPGAGDAFDF